MPERVTVATTDDLAPGEGMAVTVDRGDGDGCVGIAVFNVDGEFHAVANRCTHVGGSLGNGRLAGTVVTCPLHGAKFDVTTGDVLQPPADEPARAYDVEVDDGEVVVVL
ncbi:MAG TPA: Rieske 2Fe-2S domain-containing protein [Halobacteriales archaeon]|nr:Rieske 2Fe-2S domain-containing protein [Halobacteriales archaeon]